jgi:glycosyltransferase involved in cell wall biosynthesis
LFELRRAAEAAVSLRCPGALDTTSLVPLLRGAEVAVIPSRWHETGPLTVLEARAAGLAVVGSRRGGIAELCADDPSALLVEPEDPVALADALDKLESDRARVAAMRAAVPPPRTMLEVAQDVNNLYEELLERPAASTRLYDR